MKSAYSRDYVPPAPVLTVALAVPTESTSLGPFAGLVDTGSDGTFIPTQLVEELDVPIVYEVNVRSHLGEEQRRVSVYKIDLMFDLVRLPNIEVVGDDWGTEVIIGRNALNKLQLLLDGPRQSTEIK